MGILSYRRANIFVVVMAILFGCSSVAKENKDILHQRVSSSVKTYRDADLYNTYESKDYGRLGMITLKKYFQKNELSKIEVFFDDYYEKGESIYRFRKGRLYEVEKVKRWDGNKKTVKRCKKSAKSFKRCTHKDMITIEHDVKIYQKYNGNK